MAWPRVLVTLVFGAFLGAMLMWKDRGAGSQAGGQMMGSASKQIYFTIDFLQAILSFNIRNERLPVHKPDTDVSIKALPLTDRNWR
jgi:hypothetical protein